MNSSGNRNKNKQIAKNTVALYIRMVVMMVITLFTSRIVLKELGVTDYGLYNVVGGVVTLFAFLRSSMSSSTQRFLSFEMGKGNVENLRNIFSICFSSHLLIASVLFILAETLGLWFLNSQINIPDGRLDAANYIYQFSVLSLCASVVSIPYTADIISNEKMGYFAFLGVFDAVLKLLIAYMIAISPFDKLVFYGFLMFLVVFINLILNWIYCYHKFAETHYRFYWDKESFKRVFSFSGWTIWGQLAVVGSNQGSNILVNIFFSVAANAAMGVGHQVNNAITGLISNFQTAFKPQITKSFAERDFDYLNTLTKYAAKISFFLLFFVSLPIVANIDIILKVWLDKVPEYADSLCVVFIFASLCNAISAPLYMNIFATGNIKRYQIMMSFAYLIELVIVYLLFKIGMSLIAGISMKALLNFFVIFIRLYYTKKTNKFFNTNEFLIKAMVPLISISILFFFGAYYLSVLHLGLILQLCITIVIEIFAIMICYYFGLTCSEKLLIKKVSFKKILKK